MLYALQGRILREGEQLLIVISGGVGTCIPQCILGGIWSYITFGGGILWYINYSGGVFGATLQGIYILSGDI